MSYHWTDKDWKPTWWMWLILALPPGLLVFALLCETFGWEF